jgi:hypothetical protein
VEGAEGRVWWSDGAKDGGGKGFGWEAGSGAGVRLTGGRERRGVGEEGVEGVREECL